MHCYTMWFCLFVLVEHGPTVTLAVLLRGSNLSSTTNSFLLSRMRIMNSLLVTLYICPVSSCNTIKMILRVVFHFVMHFDA
jgi:hypothetical protein